MINTHIDEITNLPTVRGTSFEKVHDFYIIYIICYVMLLCYVLTVQRRATGEINVRAEGVIFANQNLLVVCEKLKDVKETVLTEFTLSMEESLLPLIPV